MKILVTGGTGFIGSHLARALLARGDEVLITGLAKEKEPSDPNLPIVGWDFGALDWNKLGTVDVVFHEAAINDTTLLDREEMLRVNLYGSQNLFEQAIAAGCKKIIYASSTAVYGNGAVPYREDQELKPLNPYAESKALLDGSAMDIAKKHPEAVIIGLRYCNVYGPGERRKGKRATMIWQLAQQMRTGNPRIFKYGEQKRDYVYVKDVVNANMLAIDATTSGIYNCAFGKAVSFNAMVELLNQVLGVERLPEYIDNPYGLRYQAHTECDMSLAKEKIGFIPSYDIRSGIADYFASGFLV